MNRRSWIVLSAAVLMSGCSFGSGARPFGSAGKRQLEVMKTFLEKKDLAQVKKTAERVQSLRDNGQGITPSEVELVQRMASDAESGNWDGALNLCQQCLDKSL